MLSQAYMIWRLIPKGFRYVSINISSSSQIDSSFVIERENFYGFWGRCNDNDWIFQYYIVVKPFFHYPWFLMLLDQTKICLC